MNETSHLGATPSSAATAAPPPAIHALALPPEAQSAALLAALRAEYARDLIGHASAHPADFWPWACGTLAHICTQIASGNKQSLDDARTRLRELIQAGLPS